MGLTYYHPPIVFVKERGENKLDPIILFKILFKKSRLEI